ncbi:hypothetical protein AAY42_10305 [Flagellimonas eckloniae]|uniref:Uncharacterized protein n=1 Tax=Flagellimonas eckloniae TaxID=346185 RepID=A0A0Q0XGJ6_9FLAO|nr:hypothetical protein AAY42_10305 [Allomuricauda eckloniae]
MLQYKTSNGNNGIREKIERACFKQKSHRTFTSYAIGIIILVLKDPQSPISKDDNRQRIKRF